MYNKKDINCPAGKSRHTGKLLGMILLALFLTICVPIGGTLAYLAAKTGSVVNTFKPSRVTCEVTEKFNEDEEHINNIKRNVNVTNTGDIDVYIRVKLVSYRVNNNNEEQIIGGDTTIPEFIPGDGWEKSSDGHYYYIKPVAPGGKPATDLIGSEGILLEDYLYQFYGETVTEEEKQKGAEPYGIKSGRPGGGKQVIEVIAEAIQADGGINGSPAVTEAWGIPVNSTNGELIITPARQGN